MPRERSTRRTSRTRKPKEPLDAGNKPAPDEPAPEPSVADLSPEERRLRAPEGAALSSDAVLIGGHQGVDVWRDGDQVVRVAYDETGIADLRNEVRLLQSLPVSITPMLLQHGEGWFSQQIAPGANVKDATLAGQIFVEDGERFRRQCIRFLWELRRREIRHGDLTPPNLFVGPGDSINAVDWAQSHTFEEEIKDRHQYSDSFLLYRTARAIPSREHPTPDTPRLIRRWMGVSGDLGGDVGVANLEGKRLLDLGAFMGDIAMMAVAEGMEALAIDATADSLVAGRDMWRNLLQPNGEADWLPDRLRMLYKDIVDMAPSEFEGYDAIVCFSTWPYIVNVYGRERAEQVLRDITATGTPLYFECQLYGDGPGPDFLKTNEDMRQFLSQFGSVRPIVEDIPVTGRPAFRTTWRVQQQ